MKRLDDLQLNGLKLIQDTELFCFGTDSVLLSDFAKATAKDTVLDLCTGNGIIPILMSEKTRAKKFYGMEIQECSYKLCLENIELNGLGERFTAINDDIASIDKYFKCGSVDVISCNPPYMSDRAGFTNPEDTLAIARHEIKTNLSAIAAAVAYALKFGGHFYMVHRADRLCDIICTLRDRGLEPKRLAFVHPSPDKAPKLILIDAVMGAKPSLKIENPIYVNI